MSTIDDHPRGADSVVMSLLKRSLFLLIVLVLCGFILGAIAFSRDGHAGLSASNTALLTSVVGGWLALLVGDFLGWLLSKEVAAFAHAVFGMLVRASVSLAVCAVAYGFQFSVSEHGLVFYVLAFYMVTLTVETGFSVRQLSTVDFVASDSAKGQA